MKKLLTIILSLMLCITTLVTNTRVQVKAEGHEHILANLPFNDGVADNVTWEAWTRSDALPCEASVANKGYANKYYYLTSDVYITARQTYYRSVTIDLNGYSIYKAEGATFADSLFNVSGKWVNPLIITNSKATVDENGFLTSTAGIKNVRSTGTSGGVISASGDAEKNEYPNVKLYGINFEGNSNIRTANDEWMPGAIFWRSKQTLTIDTCSFKNNISGSALDNTSTYGAGGAITIKEPGTVNINKTVFDGNKAGQRGSAIIIPAGVAGTLNINNSKFINNEITSTGAGSTIMLHTGTTTISNTSFVGNINKGNNGTAITAQGTAVLSLNDVSMTDNVNTYNYTYKAALVAIDNAKVSISGNTIIAGNTCPDSKEHNIFLRSSGSVYPKLDITSLGEEADLSVATLPVPTADTPYVVVSGSDQSAHIKAENAAQDIYYYGGNTILGINPTALDIEQESIEVAEGDTSTLTTAFTPEYATKTLVWTSGDESVASVNQSGVVTGVGEGNTTITATVNGTDISDTCSVTVKAYKTVTFKNGESVFTSDTVLKGNAVAKPATDPVKDDFNFIEWRLNGVAYDFSQPVTEDIVLEAYFSANEYTVTFVNNGGTINEGNVATYVFGTGATLPTNVTRANYAFAGWYLDEDCLTERVYSIGAEDSGNKTYYAKWTANQYQITFDKNGGECNTENKTVTYGQAYGELPEASKLGHDFSGWKLSTDLEGEFITEISIVDIDGDATLVAIYNIPTYPVVYKDVNDAEFSGTHGETYPTIYAVDSNYDLDMPSKTGYAFLGYFLNADGSGSAITSLLADSYSDTITLYAKWEKETYNITYNQNGGTINEVYAATYQYGDLITLPTNLTRDDFLFGGWYDNATFTGTAVSQISTSEYGHKEFYAKWIAHHTHEGCNDGVADGVEWIAWTRSDALPSVTSLGDQNAYYNKYYYLTCDVYLTQRQVIQRTVTICLNGYSIYEADNSSNTGAFINVDGKWANPLTITNCKAVFDSDGYLISTAGFHNSSATGTEGAVLVGSGKDGQYPNVRLYGINFADNSDIRNANDEWMPGAIFWRSQNTLTIDSCAFRNNISGNTKDNTSTYGAGGAITIKEPGTVSISNTLFDGNAAGVRGSAILVPAGVNARLNVTGSKFTNNRLYSSSATGGVIYVGAGTTTIKNSIFTGNDNAGNNGTVIGAFGSGSVTLDGVTITDNTNTNQYTTYKAAVVSSNTPTLIIKGNSVITGNKNSANKEANVFLRNDGANPRIDLEYLGSEARIGVETKDELKGEATYLVAFGVDAREQLVADNPKYSIYYVGGNTVLGLAPTITADATDVEIDVNDQTTISIVVSPSFAASSVVWSSDDITIATIEDGVVKGVKVGETVVKATINGVEKEFNVKVTPGKLIRFETNGGTPVESQYVSNGFKVVKPDDPTKEGYTFLGWCKDGELYDFDTLVSAPFVLVAKWAANDSGVSNISFVENVVDDVRTETATNFANNAADIIENIKNDSNENIIITDEQETKIKSADNLESVIEIGANDDVLTPTKQAALEAKMETSYLLDVFDITIKLSVQNKDTTEQIIDEQVVHSLPSKTLFTIKSDLINADANVIKIFAIHTDSLSNITVEEIQIVSVDKENHTVSFYADKFSNYVVAAGNKVKVSFESNGGSGVGNVYVDYNTALTKPANPTKEGYGFAGWFIDEELTEVYDFSLPVTEELKLYANWHEHDCIDGLGDDIEWIPWTSDNSLPTNSNEIYNKYFYLTKDVYLSSKQNIYRTVTICLNGHSIYKAEDATFTGAMIEINGKWANPVTFVDCLATFDENGFLTSSAGIKNAYSTGTTGGAIYLRDAALCLIGVELSNNTCVNDNNYFWNGGAILNRGGQLYAYNSVFKDNKAGDVSNPDNTTGGGGAIALKGGTAGLLTEDGNAFVYAEKTLFKNNSAVMRGAAINSDTTANVVVRDCEFVENSVVGNTAIGGAALYFNGGTQATIENCVFDGNTNDGMRGSAVTIESNSTSVAFKDCTFTNNINKTNAKRAAIVIQDAKEVTLEGEMYFKNNMNGTVLSNILLRKDGFKLGIKQLSEGSNVTIDTDIDYLGEIVTDEYGDRVRVVNDPDYFLVKAIEEEDYASWDSKWLQYEKNDFFIKFVKDEDKQFEYDLDMSHRHRVCCEDGEHCSHEDDHEVLAYQPWSKTDSLPMKSGAYYLTVDVTLKDGIDISDKTDIKICLNGHTIKQTKDEMWIYRLSKDSTLTISDCTATGGVNDYQAGTLTGATAAAIVLRDDIIRDKAKRGTKFELYGGILKNNHNIKSGGQVQQYGHSVFNMYGGMITGGYTTYSGGAVSTEVESVCNIYGGYLIKNKAKSNAGAIYAKGGTVNIYGGTFKNNLVSYEDTKNNSLGGAIYVCASSTLNMKGGLITGNEAYKGGGVFTLRSKVNISGGTISYNKSKENAGGIFIATKCEFNVTGGIISNNKGAIGGGLGFYDASGTMRNVTISNNTAENRAGGVYVTRDSKVTMINCKIINNSAPTYAGGIYIDRGTDLTLTKTTIQGNESKASGGFMANNDGVTATFNDVKFIGNKAYEGDGGGMAVMNHAVVTIKSGEFKENEATNSGGAIFIRKAYLVVEDILVENNKAVASGGGMEIEGIDVSIKKPVLLMSGGTVRNNEAPRGGGIYVTKGNATFTGGIIEENTALEGAGLYARNVGYIDATDLIIRNNTASDTAGGLYLARGTRSFLKGVVITGNSGKDVGGMYLNDDCQMADMTIKENKASDGVGGLLIDKGDYDGESYNSSIIKMQGNMVIIDNQGKISDFLLRNGSTVGITINGLGKDTKMKLNTDGANITRVLVGAYNYEKAGEDYLVTYGTEYVLEQDENIPQEEKNTNTALIGVGIGAGVLALAGIGFAAIKSKKKKKEGEAK